MKRVLVTAAGGAPAWNFIRSLRDAPEPFRIVGVDSNPYTLQRAETDARYLVPRVGQAGYLEVLRDILREEEVEFLHCQMNTEMITLSDARDFLEVRTFLPAHATIVTCQSKWRSYLKWREAGLPVPETTLVETEADLKRAMHELGPKVWIREISGSAGKGALPTADFEMARRWIDARRGWGRFVAATCLEADTVTWQSLWHAGELVVAQGRKRLYWEFADRSPSGVTGVTGAGVTVSDPVVDRIGLAAVRAVDPCPNGIFGVDLTYDRTGTPNITEINIGRFFTTHYFFTAAGLNMPHVYVRLGYGEPVEAPPVRINPLPPGLLWIRGMDRTPVLIRVEEVTRCMHALEERQVRAAAQHV
jgi:carbamoyl-phosphate synthase large subunit